jgi:hypothetical protein
MSGMRKAPPISTSSPRETMTSPPGASAPGEQHGGGVVVDHGGGLGAGQLAHQVLDDAVAVAAAAAGQVVFQVVRAGHHGLGHAATASCGSRARPRLVWITVPVRLNTARIAAAGAAAGAHARRRPGHRRRSAERQVTGQGLRAQGGQQRARLVGDQGVAMGGEQRRAGGQAQQPVERGQVLWLEAAGGGLAGAGEP